MANELICIKQLPIIEEQLQLVKTAVEERVSAALSLVCTEDTVQSVKKARAVLNAELKQWEEKRLEVKREIIKPYENFENTYKECVQNVYKHADEELKNKIQDVENELKQQKENCVKQYFYEYAKSCDVDWVRFENCGVKITLSASLKKLKEEVKAYIDKICEGLDIIDAQSEYSDEMRVEYKNGCGVSEAITTVINRHRAIDAEKTTTGKTLSTTEENSAAAVVPVGNEPLTAPEIMAEEPMYTMCFTVKATLAKLKELKKYMSDNDITFEGSNQ